MALVLTMRLATLHELQTVYDSEAFYDLLEVASVSQFNR